MNKLFFLILFVIIFGVCFGKKCCANNEQLKNATGTDEDPVCVKTNRLTRLEFNNNNINQPLSEDFYCVDSFWDSTRLFNFSIIPASVNNETIHLFQKLNPVDQVERKCCPQNLIYNAKLHSCVPLLENNTLIPSPEGFLVKIIGLPHCRTIKDYIFDNLNQVNDKILSTSSAYCFSEELHGKYVVRSCEDDSFCSGRKCLRKCCPDGQSFISRSNCFDTYNNGLYLDPNTTNAAISHVDDEFAIIHKYACNKIYYLSPKRSNFSINENGTLNLYIPINNSFVSYQPESDFTYCIEHVQKSKLVADGYHVFMCLKDNVLEEKYELAYWPKLISSIALALTIFIYIWLGKTKNLFGKSLVCFCACCLVTFSLVTYLHSVFSMSVVKCYVIGYILLFTVFGMFAWLNIICWNVWSSFGTPRTLRGRREFRTFIHYNLYGFGVPLLLTVNIFIFEKMKILPYYIQPKVGYGKCFIEQADGTYGHLLFKDGPLLLMEIANLVLFYLTVSYCLKVKDDIKRMNDSTASNRFNASTEKLVLSFKLFVIMGISFIFEVVSGFVKMSSNPVTKYIEIVWDFIICLQGVFIFIIFICKRTTLKEIQQRITCSKNTNESEIQLSLNMNNYHRNHRGTLTSITTNSTKI